MQLDVDKLRTLRRESGHTQTSAAKAAGYSTHQQWQPIENGVVRNLKLSTLYRIAEVLGVHPRELLKPLPKPKRASRSRSALKARELSK